MFLIHLSAIGVDFHPVRSQGRRELQTLLTALYGTEPEAPEAKRLGLPKRLWGDESVDTLGAPARSLGDARVEGAATLAAAARRLAKLISDIHERPPLTERLTPV